MPRVPEHVNDCAFSEVGILSITSHCHLQLADQELGSGGWQLSKVEMVLEPGVPAPRSSLCKTMFVAYADGFLVFVFPEAAFSVKHL